MIPRTATFLGTPWRVRHRELWPLGALLAAVAIAAVLWNEPTVWVGDNRFELYENPGRRLSRMFSIWDPSRGLGRVRADFWPGVTLPIAFLRSVGFSAAITEHLWHASLLASGGIGTAAFLRRFVPRIGVAHMVAGLVYMLGPYSVGFLLPSNLYLNYAVAPWIFLLFHQGIHARDPWRPVAGLALVVFAVGNTEVAGLVYAFFYLVPLALYSVHVDRTTTWGRVWRWGWRFSLLAGMVSAVAIFTTLAGAEVFDQNLRETEAPDVLNGNSSWAESWRGLGSWLLYHRDVTGFSRPQTLGYLSDWPAISASFVPPALAVGAIAFSRSRVRVLFGSMMLFGLVLMVGIHPLDDPSPYGRALDWAYEEIPKLGVLRNNYKAGSGMVLSVAALSGLAVSAVADRIRRRRRRSVPIRASRSLRTAGALVVLVVLGALTQPFWQRNLYNPAWELEAVPTHVTDAMSWLDDQPAGARVLFLPRAYRNGFRWGWVNDDVLDTYLARPHLVEVPIHLSRPLPADLLTAVDASLVDRRYRRGEIGPLARTLGVDLVVIRNDHDWDTWDQPRPSDYDDLRSDPAMELVAQFGRLGAFTAAEDDTSAAAERERELPPIEVYRLSEPGSIVRVTGPEPELLVSGAGAAVPLLGTTGLLDAGAGVRFTGRLEADEMAGALENGSPLVITDTNRRRVEVITTAAEESYTLAAGERLTREPFEFFDTAGAETVASYGDVRSVRATAQVAFTGGLQPWHRPPLALDGDPDTTWLVGGLSDPVGEVFRVDMNRPTLVSGVRLLAASPGGAIGASGRRLAGATIAFSDGTVAAARLVDGRYTLEFEPREVEWVSLTITDVEGFGLAPVGIAELDIIGVDSVEYIVAPTDVAAAATESARLDSALRTAEVVYAFQRVQGEGPVDEERALRREFTALRADDMVLEGRLALTASISEDKLSLITETPIRVRSTGRFLGGLNFAGANVADGSLESGWVSRAEVGVGVDLRFPRRSIETVTLIARVGQGLSSVNQVTLDIGGVEVRSVFPRTTCASGSQCRVVATVRVSSISTDRMSVTVTDVDSKGLDGGNPSPIRIDEVELNGEPNVFPGEQAPHRCIDDLITVDGISVPVRLGRSVELARRGFPVGFRSCDPVQLERATTQLESDQSVLVDTAVLRPSTFEPQRRQAARNVARVVAEDQTTAMIEVDAADGGLLISGQSYHPAWSASLNGSDLGPPIEVDTFAAWRLPPGTTGLVELDFGWQRPFEAAMAMTFASVGLACWLRVRRER